MFFYVSQVMAKAWFGVGEGRKGTSNQQSDHGFIWILLSDALVPSCTQLLEYPIPPLSQKIQALLLILYFLKMVNEGRKRRRGP